MENEASGPSRQGGKPEWFLGWLQEVFLPSQAKDPISSQLEVILDVFEKSQRIPADKATVQMPWDQLTVAETKIISRAVESLKEQDFPPNPWSSGVSTIPISTTNSLSPAGLGNLPSYLTAVPLLALDAGAEARADTYSYLNLLQLITIMVHSPESRDQAIWWKYVKV